MLLLISCGDNQPDNTLKSEDNFLHSAKQVWESKAFLCQGEFPSKMREDGQCDDGDMTLFNGLLCASGDKLGCQAVKRSQTLNGQWWRSPRRARTSNLGDRNSFSRDMALGVLLYLVETKDTQAANRWWTWIKNNRPCSLQNPFNGKCMIKGFYRYCKDDNDFRCTITPGMLYNMSLVWKHIGLQPPSAMKSKLGEKEDQIIHVLAKDTKVGYQLHLKSVAAFLKMSMHIHKTRTKKLVEVLIQKQPNNLFFQYLDKGQSPSLAQRLVEICPDHHFSGRLHQWSWERDTKQQAWQNSMMWDCIFMANLLAR